MGVEPIPAQPAPMGKATRLVAGIADVAAAILAPDGVSTPTLDLALGALTLGARRVDAAVLSTGARLHSLADAVGGVPIVASVVTSVRERRIEMAATGASERTAGRSVLLDLVRTTVDRVDMGAVVDAIDLNAVLSRIDVGAILDNVDLDVVVERIDVQAVIEKVDIAAVVERIDIDDLIARTELGAIIAQSTSGMATHALDAVRSQTVGLDGFSNRIVDKVMRRRGAPEGPPMLVSPPPPEPT